MRVDNETRLGERPAVALSDRLHAMIVEARLAGFMPAFQMEFRLCHADWLDALRMWTHMPLYTARRAPRFMGVPCVLDVRAERTTLELR